jgi:hypothetical protein
MRAAADPATLTRLVPESPLGVDALGRVAVHRRVRRKQLLGFLVKLEPCLVGMEACGSAHY